MDRKPVIAAIDPGYSGAITWIDTNGLTHSENIPEELGDLISLIRQIEHDNFGIMFYMEDVGTYMPGNAGPSAVRFARHCGHLDAIIETLHLRCKYIRPQKWMKEIPHTKFRRLPPGLSEKEKGKELGKRKRIRKNDIKKFVESKFPTQKITLKNSDAFGLLYWGMKFDTQKEFTW